MIGIYQVYLLIQTLFCMYLSTWNNMPVVKIVMEILLVMGSDILYVNNQTILLGLE
jgi:hypothetical protein